jgi:NTP pyrophosphatase (non-canonical NTP hydrolase)
MDFNELQKTLHEWRQYNFPDTYTLWHQFMGVTEELGEMAHAILKQSQGIRGSYEEHEEDLRDAVGDLTIYLMGLCSVKGWSFEEVVMKTADTVLRRDWVENPDDGYAEDVAKAKAEGYDWS